MPTVIAFITDADGSAGTVAVTAAQSRTRFPDVHVIHGPAVALARGFVLDPAKLCRTEHTKESQTLIDLCINVRIPESYG